MNKEALAMEIFKQKAVIDTVKERLKQENGKLDELEKKALTMMDADGLDSFKIAGLGTIYLQTTSSVKVPKLDSDRQAFFAYLKDRGIFDNLITVNSQTLNSFYKEEHAKAVSEGNSEFKIPGINEITFTKEVRTRKS